MSSPVWISQMQTTLSRELAATSRLSGDMHTEVTPASMSSLSDALTVHKDQPLRAANEGGDHATVNMALTNPAGTSCHVSCFPYSHRLVSRTRNDDLTIARIVETVHRLPVPL